MGPTPSWKCCNCVLNVGHELFVLYGCHFYQPEYESGKTDKDSVVQKNRQVGHVTLETLMDDLHSTSSRNLACSEEEADDDDDGACSTNLHYSEEEDHDADSGFWDSDDDDYERVYSSLVESYSPASDAWRVLKSFERFNSGSRLFSFQKILYAMDLSGISVCDSRGDS
jgi:hypothetical protein